MQEGQDSSGRDLSLRVWISAPLPFLCSRGARTIRAEHTLSQGRGQPLLATTEWKRSQHQLGFPERALAVDRDCVCDSIWGELNLISVTFYHFRRCYLFASWCSWTQVLQILRLCPLCCRDLSVLRGSHPIIPYALGYCHMSSHWSVRLYLRVLSWIR